MRKIILRKSGGEVLEALRGMRVANGTVTAVAEADFEVTDATGDFSDVTGECIFMDSVTGRGALVYFVAGAVLTLDEWVGSAVGNKYVVVRVPVQCNRLVSFETLEGYSVVLEVVEDTSRFEARVQRAGVTWNGTVSDSFYIQPGVKEVTLEIPFTHASSVTVERYHGDWLSKKLDDAALAAGATAGWARWPGGSTLVVTSEVAAGGGSFALDCMFSASGAVTRTQVHPGYYRLASVGAATDKSFRVVTLRV